MPLKRALGTSLVVIAALVVPGTARARGARAHRLGDLPRAHARRDPRREARRPARARRARARAPHGRRRVPARRRRRLRRVRALRAALGAEGRMATPMRRLAALLPAVVLLVAGGDPRGGPVREPVALARDACGSSSSSRRRGTRPRRPMVALPFRATNLTDRTLRDAHDRRHAVRPGAVPDRRTRSRCSPTPIPAVVVEAETLAREGPIEPGASRVFELALTARCRRDRPDELGHLPAQGRPAERRRVARRHPNPGDLPGPRARAAAHALVDVRAAPADRVPSRRRLHDRPRSRTSSRPGAGSPGRHARSPSSPRPARPRSTSRSPRSLLTQLARMRDGYTVTEPDGLREVEQGKGGAALAARGARVAPRGDGVLADRALGAAVRRATDPLADLGRARSRPRRPARPRARAWSARSSRRRRIPTVLRPPGGALDEATLDALDERGVSVLAARRRDRRDAAAAPGLRARRPSPASARTAGSSASCPTRPWPRCSRRRSSPQDPVLGAQAVLGELAAIWQEQPGQARGLAMILPECLDLPGGFYGPLVRGVAAAPWLRPVTARDLVAAFPPGNPDALAAVGPGLVRLDATWTS